jgi:DNA-binding CsgD family transcriptional regulator/GAF domain-containing protein
VNGTSNKTENPRSERILGAVADAITRMYGESLAFQSRIDTDAILKTVTSTIAQYLPVTCVAILTQPDPETSRVVFADETNAGMAAYLDGYIASLLRPGEAPTYGLARKVIETGGPMLLPSITLKQLQAMVAEEARHFSATNPIPIEVDRLAILMVPMRAGPAIVGTLALFDWQAAGTLTDDDIEWTQRAADRVGLTLDNAQLRNKAIDRAERIAAMGDALLAISSEQELRATFNLILERVTSTLPVDAADILVFHETEGVVSVAASIGFRSGLSAEVQSPMASETTKQWVIGHNVGAPSAIAWIGQSRRWILAREGLKSYTAAPLMVRKRFAGALEVFGRSPLEPDQEWFGFLDAMANLAAIALDHAARPEPRRPAGAESGTTRDFTPELTNRELEILRLVVEGETNGEVAEKLRLSQNTIKFQIRRLLDKTECVNRTQLVARAIQQGWV